MNMEKYLIEMEQQTKEQEAIYRNAAARYGLSDTAMWILYHVSEGKSENTQQELCRECCFPKQTVNTALKSLINKGYAELETIAGNSRKKRIHLTESGIDLAKATTDRIKKAELSAYGKFSCDELNEYLEMTRKINANLREEFNKIFEENSDE